MLNNLLTTALRSLAKNKLYSFANIFGLAIGMAAALILAKYVGLPCGATRFADHRGDVDASVIRVREKQRHDDRIAGRGGEHISEIGGVLLAERHPHVDIASHPSDGVRHLVRRCRRSRIGAAVRRQNECHDACKPHSVFERPAQRPLRGSAPSTGFAVHGAQPIDG